MHATNYFFWTRVIQHIAKHKQMTSLKHVYRSFVLKISKYQFAMFRIFKSKSDSSIVKYLLPKISKLIYLSFKTFKIMRFIIFSQKYDKREIFSVQFSTSHMLRHIRLWSLLKIIFPSSIILIFMKNLYKIILVDPEFNLFIKVILKNCPHKFTV